MKRVSTSNNSEVNAYIQRPYSYSPVETQSFVYLPLIQFYTCKLYRNISAYFGFTRTHTDTHTHYTDGF